MLETVNFRASSILLIGVLASVGMKPLIARAPNAQHETVWDGVFTAEQAVRGRMEFNVHCSSCHSQREGVSDAPEFAGEAFLEDWGEDNLSSLFEFIRNAMPVRNPGSLTGEVYVDIVAYMLESSGFPDGDQELIADAMPTIRVEGPDGPGPVPNFSLVKFVGCLSTDDDGDWIVTSATKLIRTRDPSVSTADALQTAAESPLGTGIFELIYVFPSPDAYDGDRIEVKGLLIRDTDPDQINVSSLSSIDPICE